MARIPYTGAESIAQPGTISIPDDYMHVQASPDAFGAGIAQAGQFLGQSIDKVGGDLTAIAVRQKGFERQTSVTNAMNNYQQFGMNRLHGDPDNPQDQGYIGTRGQQAAAGWGSFAKDLDKARQDAMASLGSDPVAREMFDRSSRRLTFSFGELAAQHRQTQMQQAAVGANQAAVTLSQQDAALRWNDEDAFKNNLADALRKQSDADAAAGAPPEVREANQRKVMSDTISTRITRWAEADPMAANGYLQQHQSDLMPAQQIALTAHLKNATKQREVSDYVNEAVPPIANPTAPYVPGGAVIPPEKRADILKQATAGTMVPPDLLNAVIGQESEWDARRQRKGGSDLGLGQITEATGSNPGYGVDPISRADAADPAKNAAWTARYLEGRGKALGLLTPEDWKNPDKVSRVLQAYNGGADPNYVNNVTSRLGAAPALKTQETNGLSYTVAAPFADRVDGFLKELAATGYKVKSVQGYNNRNIAGTDAESYHARGAAFDINPAENPVNGGSNLPPNIGEIAAKYGLGWGGNWTGPKKDPMHFSFARDEGGAFDVARRGATGAQITAAGADQGAKAPLQPVTTVADYYEQNFDRLTEEARAEMQARHPDDPTYADLAVARVSQRANQAIQAQKKGYDADSNILWQAANGDPAKGVAPGSVDELIHVSPQVQQAWQRVMVQQPRLAHDIATRVLSQNTKPDDGKDAKTYGDAFTPTFQRVHAADGDPNKLTNPDDLYKMLDHGLTMAGIEKLRGEIMSRRTPEGEAEASLRSQFFKTARSQISGADDGLGLRDPKGEAQFLRFQAKAYDEINTARAAGKSASQIYNPDSPDYVGKIIPSYKRSLAQRTADMLDAAKDSQPAAPAEQPGFFGRWFGGGAPDLSSPQGVQGAFASGKITREEARQRIRTLLQPKAETE